MGTPCVTDIHDENGDVIVTMYRHWDGFPEGYGAELEDFLAEFTVGNGVYQGAKLGEFANGMECLAAQIVAHFKTEVGNIYLYKAGTRGIGEEYIYHVELKDGKLFVRCIDEESNKLYYHQITKGEQKWD